MSNRHNFLNWWEIGCEKRWKQNVQDNGAVNLVRRDYKIIMRHWSRVDKDIVATAQPVKRKGKPK